MRFTVEQYERMGEVGILDADVRTELLDGEIVFMSPMGTDHASVVDTIDDYLHERLQGRVAIRIQSPVRLPPRSEPEPDIVVARRRRDRYRSAHPTAEDVLLFIEVAVTSLRFDQLVKLPIYAQQGIVEVWIVDVTGRAVHVHTDPVDGAYRTVRTVTGDDPIVPTALPDVSFTPAEFLDG